MKVNDEAYYVCIKDFYMDKASTDGRLAFKKGKIYLFVYLGHKDFTYVTEEDEDGGVHYMGQKDIDNFFKKDDRAATKILLKDK